MSEVSCDSCIGACCSDIKVVLSATEAEKLLKAGTKLTTVLIALKPLLPDSDVDESELFSWSNEVDELIEAAKSKKMPRERNFWMDVANQARFMKPEQGFFIMDGPCGFLQKDGTCGDYENRPDICREFTVGGTACLGFRERAEVDVPIELTQKPVATQ